LNAENYPTFWQTLLLPFSGLITIGHFGQPYIEQEADGELYLMMLIGGALVFPTITYSP
jgi:hypothetical protein